MSETLMLILEMALEMATDTKGMEEWFRWNSKEIFRLHDDHKVILREKYKAKQNELRKRR